MSSSDPKNAGAVTVLITRRVKAGHEAAFEQAMADMTAAAVREVCRLTSDVATLLCTAVEQFGLSARAYNRILKVSRTIADLEGAERLEAHHVAEAVQYRSLDRKLWA